MHDINVIFVAFLEKRVTNLKDKFIIATNGKKLCRVKSLKETSGNSSTKILNTTNVIKSSFNMSQKINYKNNIRYVITLLF